MMKMRKADVLTIANYAADGCGWEFEGIDGEADLTVLAWADLHPFGME